MENKPIKNGEKEKKVKTNLLGEIFVCAQRWLG